MNNGLPYYVLLILHIIYYLMATSHWDGLSTTLLIKMNTAGLSDLVRLCIIMEMLKYFSCQPNMEKDT